MIDNEMFCLSIRQPWALLICAGARTIENRTWATGHRGLIAIHSSGSRKEVDQLLRATNNIETDVFSFGAIIGTAKLVDIVTPSDLIDEEPWADGPNCWRFEEATLFTDPVPCRGQLKLFPLDSNTAAAVRSELLKPNKKVSKEVLDECLSTVRGRLDHRKLRWGLRHGRVGD